MESKTRPPTKKKLDDARKDGQVVNVHEFGQALQLLVLLTFFNLWSDRFVDEVLKLFDLPFRSSGSFRVEMANITVQTGTVFVLVILPLLVALAVVSVLAEGAQVGAVVSFEKVMPDVTKLNPISGFKNLFSIESLAVFLLHAVEVGVLVYVVWYNLRHYGRTLLNSGYCSPNCFTPVLWVFVQRMVLAVMAVQILAFGIQYVIKYRKHINDLMMTHSEVKNEHRETNGNPEVKKKQREIRDELLAESGGDTLEMSNLVVRNPDHIAVCIRYSPPKVPLPRVSLIVKGGAVMGVVRQAELLGIPVVENRKIARALASQCRRGDWVPKSLLVAVAHLLVAAEQRR